MLLVPLRNVDLYDEHASLRRSVSSSVVTIVDRFRKKAEAELTAELVRELLRDQQPDLADRPLTLGACGWDNPTSHICPAQCRPRSPRGESNS
jgi:hypothetical protein